MKKFFAFILSLTLLINCLFYININAEEAPYISLTQNNSSPENGVAKVMVYLKNINYQITGVELELTYDINKISLHPVISKPDNYLISSSQSKKIIVYSAKENGLIPNNREIYLCTLSFVGNPNESAELSIGSNSFFTATKQGTSGSIILKNIITSNKINVTLPKIENPPVVNPGTGGTGGGTSSGGGGGGGGFVPILPQVPSFTDLEGFDWAKESINFLAFKGIVKGTSQNTFSPTLNVKRADFILLIVRTFELKADVLDNFADVSSDKYYYEAVGIAKKLGIAKGNGDSFNPEGKITRQDLMTLLYRALLNSEKINKADNLDILNNFEDKDKISSYAKEPLANMVFNGIVRGRGNLVAPQDNATRAETAVIFYRVYKLLNE